MKSNQLRKTKTEQVQKTQQTLHIYKRAYSDNFQLHVIHKRGTSVLHQMIHYNLT